MGDDDGCGGREGGGGEEEEEKDLEMIDSDGEADEIERPWWYNHLDMATFDLTCEYCGSTFLVGNCGTDYNGKGYCYECMAMKRIEITMTTFTGKYFPKANKEVHDVE